MASRDAPADRQHLRVPIDAFVRVFGDESEYVFRTRDVSDGGLFLYTRVSRLYPFRVGQALDVELYDFDRTVEFRAVVVRIVEPGTPEAERSPAGFGIKIIELDDTNKRHLAELIARAR